jgi:hypothetical protein
LGLDGTLNSESVVINLTRKIIGLIFEGLALQATHVRLRKD